MFSKNHPYDAIALSYANNLGTLVLKAYAAAGFEVGPGDPKAPYLTDAESRTDLYLLGYLVGALARMCISGELKNASDQDRANVQELAQITLARGLFGHDHAVEALRLCFSREGLGDAKFKEGFYQGGEEVAAGANDYLWKHLARRQMMRRQHERLRRD